MQKGVLISLSLFITIGSHAQDLSKERVIKQQRQFVMQMLQHNPKPAGKTTQLQERLTGVLWYDGGATNVDSMHLTYSGTRASAYNFNTMSYDLGFPYGNNVLVEGFDGRHIYPTVLADSVWYYAYNNSFGYWDIYGQIASAYNLNNKMTSYFSYNNTTSTLAEYNTVAYNVQNNITDIRSYSQSINNLGNPWDTFAHFVYSYDAQGRLATDTFYVYNNNTWNLNVWHVYDYDNANNLISLSMIGPDNGTTDTLGKFTNTYYNDNRVKTISYSYRDVDSQRLIGYIKDTFGYSNGADYNTYWLETVNFNYLDTITYVTKHLNAQNLPDTVYSTLNYGHQHEITIGTYDSYNNPVLIKVYDTIDLSVPLMIYKYYYETFDVGVKKLPLPDDVKIYPNPVTDLLYISTEKYRNKDLTVSIINSLGQTVKHSLFNVSGIYRLPMADIKPGMYWIRIQDSQGNVVHTQTVVKN